MAFEFDTVANLVSDAAVRCGLGTVSDVYGSTDANIVRMRVALKDIGLSLLRERDWSYLQKEHTLTTSAGDSTYDLPADYDRLIAETAWNRTKRLPLAGALTPPEWQYLEGRATGLTLTVLFRIKDRQIQLYPDSNTPADHTLAFEYISRYWVQATGQTTGTKTAPTANTDTILFEPALVRAALARRFLRETNQDSTSADADYADALHAAKAADTVGRVLDIGRQQEFDPLLGDRNIPVTGFGT